VSTAAPNGATAASFAIGCGLGWLAERRLADPGRSGPLTPPPMPAADRELTVAADDGTSLHVEVRGPWDATGPADTAAAPTLVLAHGWTMQRAVWRHQLAALARRWRVVAYDQRGHGRSAMPANADWSAPTLGGDLRRVCDATVPTGERCVIAGHSMGAMALLALAQAEPGWARERVAGSVLASTGASELWRRSALCRDKAILAALGRPLVPWLLGPWGPVGLRADLMYYTTRAVALTAGADPRAVAEVERMVLECPARTRARVAEMLVALDVSGGIPRVPGPVEVLVGEHDRLTPPHQADRLVAGRDDAELVVLDGIGHMAPLEAPETLNARLDAFARAVVGSRATGTVAPRGSQDLDQGREAAGG